jgi:hypothetical protein
LVPISKSMARLLPYSNVHNFSRYVSYISAVGR